jgi:type II secretory pathway pseudopilin PulG
MKRFNFLNAVRKTTVEIEKLNHHLMIPGFNTNQGFGLVEVMVATGLTAGLALVTAQVAVQARSAQRMTDAQSADTQTMSEMSNYLFSSSTCNQNFTGKKIGDTIPNFSVVDSAGNVSTRFAPGNAYPSKIGSTLKSMKLTNVGGVDYLSVDFDRPFAKGVMKSATREVPLNLTKDGSGTVTSCQSQMDSFTQGIVNETCRMLGEDYDSATNWCKAKAAAETRTVTLADTLFVKNPNVGINVSNPGYPLEINGSINIQNSSYNHFIRMSHDNPRRYFTMRMVDELSSAPGASGAGGGSWTYSEAQFILTNTFGNGYNQDFSFKTNAGELFRIGKDHVYSHRAIEVTSDARAKDFLGEVDSDDSLQKILKLHVLRYKWKEDQASQAKIGMFAQEIRKVIPEAVNVAPGEIDGKKVQDKHTVDYDQVLNVAIAAVQSMAKEMGDLREENRKLASEVSDIKKAFAKKRK